MTSNSSSHVPVDLSVHSDNLPRFSGFTPEQFERDMAAALVDCRAVLAAVTSLDVPPTWENVYEPLSAAEHRASRVLGVASHLHGVMNTQALRDVYERMLPELTMYHTERWQNETLYRQFKQIHASPLLSADQARALSLAIQDFELSGVALPEEPKHRLMEINRRLSVLTMNFENHVMDATDRWFYHTEHLSMLEGLPESLISNAKAAAESNQQTGYRLTLEGPTVQAVLGYAKQRELRALFYQAYVTRASDQGPLSGVYDNGPVMVELLQLEQEKAKLLGFAHYAALSLMPKMAKDVSKVMPFLMELVNRAKPQAQREFQALQAFAKAYDGRSSLESWDVAYYSERQQESLYQISQEALRAYFPLTRVLAGLFELAQSLFGVRFVSSVADTWHPDVRFFEVFDEANQRIGALYMDLFARPQKRGGAWMDDYETHGWIQGEQKLPVVFLTCNFRASSAQASEKGVLAEASGVNHSDALLTHDDVVTLFHEFGHCIHHLFSTVSVHSISGIHGVEWDAVELPSQWMENFCWQPEVIARISQHVETGSPLPESTLTSLIASRCFQSAMQLLRQLEFAVFDLRLYQREQIRDVTDIQQLLDDVRRETAVLLPPKFNRFQHSFSHIFAGGYSAGYYSYLWAEILSSDAFDRFESEGILNPEVGRAFLKEILSRGGSREAGQSFEAFRGRAPSVDAFLRHRGIG